MYPLPQNTTTHRNSVRAPANRNGRGNGKEALGQVDNPPVCVLPSCTTPQGGAYFSWGHRKGESPVPGTVGEKRTVERVLRGNSEIPEGE